MQKNKVILANSDYYFNKIKPIVLYIYGYKCVCCGIKKIDNHIHHIDKNHKNNDPFNLICLCPSCHVIVHSCVNINIKIDNSFIIKQKQNLKKIFSNLKK